MKKLMKRLSLASGVSGFEDEVRDIIASELADHVDEIEEDSLGNIIAVKRGSGPVIMLAAHMDEIGLMVRHIDKKGFIRFSKIGGISDQMILNQAVWIHGKQGRVAGVIGSKPPHRMKAAERKKVTTHDNMFIDIGASSREEAEELVSVGDPITFQAPYAELPSGHD